MKISVVMATYNGEKYIVEQLDSIRLQTISADEVIICDDCSTDCTVKVVEEYIQENQLGDQWHVTVNEKNLGYAGNFNAAALKATGDYLLFADQDDIWDRRKVEIMTGIMEKTPDCVVLCTDYEAYYQNCVEKKAPKKVLKKMPDNGELRKISLTKKSPYIGALGCCMCVRREFYQKIEGYWFDGWAQDDRMWRLAQCADGCYLLHSNLVKHRIHDSNTSTFGKYHTVEKRVRLFESMKKADAMMQKMMEEQGVPAKCIRIIRKHIRMMQYRIDLLEHKHLGRCIPLLGYLGYYQEPKSYLVDAYISLKSK